MNSTLLFPLCFFIIYSILTYSTSRSWIFCDDLKNNFRITYHKPPHVMYHSVEKTLLSC